MADESMFDIKAFIRQRERFDLVIGERDSWIESISSAKNVRDDVYIVTAEKFLLSNNGRDSVAPLFERYYLAGLFDLGKPYINNDYRMVFLHFKNQRNVRFHEDANVKSAVYFGRETYDRGKNKDLLNYNSDDYKTTRNYLSTFNDYIKRLEIWTNDKGRCLPYEKGDLIREVRTPKSVGRKYEFFTIPSDSIDTKKLSPAYYMEINLYKQIGQVMRKARNSKGRTQQEMAEMMGVSRDVIIRYENGKKIPAHAVIEYSHILNVPLMNLMEGFFTDMYRDNKKIIDSIDAKLPDLPDDYLRSIDLNIQAFLEHIDRN